MTLFIPSLSLSKEDWNFNLGVERGERPGGAPSRPCYVNNLPPELLSRIFQFGIAHQTDSGLADSNDAVAYEAEAGRSPVPAASRVPASFMSVVSQICRYWHDVAIATPSLWTSITITPPTPDHCIAYLLERTKNLPIDIDCSTLSSGGYALLLAHVHRWRSMKMTFPRSESMEEFLEAASQPSIPAAAQLTTLQLRLGMDQPPSRSDDETYPPESFLTLFGGLAPRLERITFWGVHVDWNQHWISSAPNLTHLDLGFHMDEPCMSWPQLVTILRGSPKLKKLSLCADPRGTPRPQAMLVDGPIHLLDLTDLVLGDDADLLDKVYMPALKSLGLYLHHEDCYLFFPWLANMTGPSPDAQPRPLLSGLEKFKVVYMPCRQSSSVESLYGALQNIKSLTLSLEDFHDHFLKLLAKPCPLAGHDVWLPRLETIYLTDAYKSADIIHEVLREREKLGYPIKSLFVDKCDSADENLQLSRLKEDVEKFAFYNEVYGTVM